MAASVFDNKTVEPDSSELDIALGNAAPLLKSVEEYIIDQFGALSHEWKFYGKKAGWTLALVHNGRRILHLIPQAGQFTAVFTLGERAVSIAHESKLPNETKSDIDSARKYAEGRSVRLEVNSAADAEIVKQLVAVKLAS